MSRIDEMKTIVKGMMQAAYNTAAVPGTANNTQIANAGFLREQDAEAIRVSCRGGTGGSGGKFSISFRTAGLHTLTRIADGNPCKGHTILDKSIKKKDGACTYSGVTDTEFEAMKGLVGYPQPLAPGAARPTVAVPLAGLWAISGANGQQQKARAAAYPAPTGGNFKAYFTGDYDMHDLLKVTNGTLARILATVDEESAIEQFNNAILNADATRKTAVDASLANITPKPRLRESQYALIRHGAQTSFMGYLLGPGGTEITATPGIPHPLQNAVVEIDPNICIFDTNGDAYILNGIPSIYAYYKAKNMLDQIPFYYFFRDLRGKQLLNGTPGQTNALKLDPYATEIDQYITGYANRQA